MSEILLVIRKLCSADTAGDTNTYKMAILQKWNKRNTNTSGGMAKKKELISVLIMQTFIVTTTYLGYDSYQTHLPILYAYTRTMYVFLF